MLIREKDKNEIIKIAKNSLESKCSILAFGSRVNGDAHDTSDLDLVIKGSKVNSNEFIKFKNSLRESNIPILIQVLNWSSIPESFQRNILKKYETLLNID